MNQLNNIFQELGVKEEDLVRENLRPELLNKREVQLCKDGKMRPRKNMLTNEGVKISFWKRVDIKSRDNCWEWKFGKSDRITPYGVVWFNGKKFKSHRVAYELFYNKKPDKLLVCHKCDNPPCCNPYHLFLGTPMDNLLDCMKKGRDRKQIGQDRYCAKLTDEAVIDIKTNYKFKVMPAYVFARKYNVSDRAVWNIIYGLRWTHIKI